MQLQNHEFAPRLPLLNVLAVLVFFSKRIIVAFSWNTKITMRISHMARLGTFESCVSLQKMTNDKQKYKYKFFTKYFRSYHFVRAKHEEASSTSISALKLPYLTRRERYLFQELRRQKKKWSRRHFILFSF